MKRISIGGTWYPASDNTAIYPSYNASIRNRMEIHMASDAMTFEAFENLFTADLSTITIEQYKTDEVSEASLIAQTVCQNYNILSEIGRRRVDTTLPQTGVTTSEMHLVCVLEQPLYIEQLAAQVGKA